MPTRKQVHPHHPRVVVASALPQTAHVRQVQITPPSTSQWKLSPNKISSVLIADKTQLTQNIK